MSRTDHLFSQMALGRRNRTVNPYVIQISMELDRAGHRGPITAHPQGPGDQAIRSR